uniref:IS1 family transposase n=1 Tax=Xenorhabdus yunnanensis TaxID=3025878 RepID=UPI00359C5CD3
MAKVDVYCRYCHKSKEVKGHGKRNGGHPRYRCYACCKVFHSWNTPTEPANPELKSKLSIWR